MDNIEKILNEINNYISKANQEDFLDIKIEMLRVDGEDRYIDVIFGTMGTPGFAKVIVSFKNPDFIKTLLYPIMETYNEPNQQILQIATKDEAKIVVGEKLYKEEEFELYPLFKIMINSDCENATYIISEDISYQVIDNHIKSIFSHKIPVKTKANNKQKYKRLFEIVREELNKVDPIGVVMDNDNLNDEYDLENQEIIPIIKNYTDYKEFAKKICEIFVKSTEMKLQPNEFYQCAKNILEKTKNL